MMLVKDVVSKCVAECTEDTPLAEVYELIQKCEHGFVVVLDSTTHRVPLGIVNEHSICEQLIARGRKPKELRAGSVMLSRVRRVSGSTPVERCAELFTNSGSVPILAVDDQRQFCGLVDPQRLESAVRNASAPPRFSLASAIPGRPEIPVFGWLQ